MTGWVRHASISLSDGIRYRIKTATAEQKWLLEAIDRQVVELSKQPHANEHTLHTIKVKLCEVCKVNKLHDCKVREGAFRQCFFEETDLQYQNVVSPEDI